MARRISQKDGENAVAMLDSERKPPTQAPRPKSTPPKTTTRKKATARKVAPESKAARVRALLDQGKTVNEIAKALDDVSWSYAWDVAAAWERKTGKMVIAKHAFGATR